MSAEVSFWRKLLTPPFLHVGPLAPAYRPIVPAVTALAANAVACLCSCVAPNRCCYPLVVATCGVVSQGRYACCGSVRCTVPVVGGGGLPFAFRSHSCALPDSLAHSYVWGCVWRLTCPCCPALVLQGLLPRFVYSMGTRRSRAPPLRASGCEKAYCDRCKACVGTVASCAAQAGARGVNHSVLDGVVWAFVRPSEGYM